MREMRKEGLPLPTGNCLEPIRPVERTSYLCLRHRIDALCLPPPTPELEYRALPTCIGWCLCRDHKPVPASAGVRFKFTLLSLLPSSVTRLDKLSIMCCGIVAAQSSAGVVSTLPPVSACPTHPGAHHLTATRQLNLGRARDVTSSRHR